MNYLFWLQIGSAYQFYTQAQIIRIMLTKLKHAKNSKQPQKTKRIIYTQPQKYTLEQEEQQAAIKAKNYLIQLNKDIDVQYENSLIIQKSQIDISLSQWNNLDKIDYRLSEHYPKSISINVNKLDQRKISAKQFNSIEISLIEQRTSNNFSPLRKTYLSQLMKCNYSIRANPSPQQTKIKKFSSNMQPQQVSLPSKSRVVSFVVKQQKSNKLEFTPKIDIIYAQKGISEQKNTKKRQKIAQCRNKLPRLDNLQSQQYKNKYKSIFRVNNRKNIMMVPMKSPISKELSKIDDLIREESIKLLKKSI